MIPARNLVVVAMVVMTLVLAGCTSSAAPRPGIAVQSPVDTTLSWFKAINENDMPLAQAHFAARTVARWNGPASVRSPSTTSVATSWLRR